MRSYTLWKGVEGEGSKSIYGMPNVGRGVDMEGTENKKVGSKEEMEIKSTL